MVADGSVDHTLIRRRGALQRGICSLARQRPSWRYWKKRCGQERTGADMKVNVEIDCTPLEARQFFGLPDVGPMQTAMMEKLQQQMASNIDKISPDALLQSWFTFDPKLAERFQEMFVTMMGGSIGSDRKK
jgi:hypothetical protein